MDQESDDKRLIRQYLLGELPEEDRTRLEERFLADDEYFAQVRTVEQDLIDEYARGELSEAERGPFERQFLSSPQGRRDVKLAKAWQRNVSPAPAAAASPAAPDSWWQTLLAVLRPGPALKLSGAAAGLLLVLAGAWLTIQTVGGHRQRDRLQA